MKNPIANNYRVFYMFNLDNNTNSRGAFEQCAERVRISVISKFSVFI